MATWTWFRKLLGMRTATNPAGRELAGRQVFDWLASVPGFVPSADGKVDLAQFYYETGEIKSIYQRILSDDGTRWIRHGPYVMFGRNGKVVSEGGYVDGLQQGQCRDFHENGTLVATGLYKDDVEVAGTWRYWDADGRLAVDEFPGRSDTG